jgi:Glycosyl hydrolase family 12
VKKLLSSSAFLAVIAIATGLSLSCASRPPNGKSPAVSSAPRGCTAAKSGACNFGHWIIYNNSWGPSPGTYLVRAHSPGDWSVTASQNRGGGCAGCAVEAYESAQWDYSDVPYSSIKYLYSSFSETMPTGSLQTNGIDAEATYDMFIKGSDTNEVMVWVDNQGQTPEGSRYGVAVIHGQKFDVYVAAGTKSFVLEKNETSGTIHYRAVLGWLHAHGMLKSSDTLTQFNFGFEIASTGGKAQTFIVRSLTLHQEFR